MSTAEASNSNDRHILFGTPFLMREMASGHTESIGPVDSAAATLTPTIKSFNCPNCNLSFPGKKLLRTHKRKTHPETVKSFDCSSCGLAFSKRKKLAKHTMEEHLEATIPVEPATETSAVSVKSLDPPSHNLSPPMKQNKHAKKKGKGKKSHSKVINAVISATVTTAATIESFDCPSCNLPFPSETLLCGHQKTMHPETVKPFDCSSCSLAFSTRKKLSRHTKKEHLEIVNPVESTPEVSVVSIDSFDCLLCNLSFPTNEGVLNHKKDTHPKCPQCKKRFRDLAGLQNHQKITEHCYCCECSVYFPILIEQLTHMRSITHATPHYCCDCDREYSNQEILKYHCCDCDAVLTRQRGLRKHLLSKMHRDKVAILESEGPRNFAHQCKECGKRFRGKNELRIHISLSHEPSRNIPCPAGGKCIKKFATPPALLNHLESGYCKSGMTRAKLHQLVFTHDSKHYITSDEATEPICSSGQSPQPSALVDPSSDNLSGKESPLALPHSNDNNLNEWSVIIGGPLTPTSSDSDWSVIGGIPLTPSRSISVSEWSLISQELVDISSPIFPSNTQFQFNQHEGGGYQELCCDLCPPDRKPFRSLKSYQAHINSAAHAPKIFHCPLSLIPNVKPEDLPNIRHFSTLGGLAQHLESGRCEGGIELYNKAINFVEEQLSLLGLSGLLPPSN